MRHYSFVAAALVAVASIGIGCSSVRNATRHGGYAWTGTGDFQDLKGDSSGRWKVGEATVKVSEHSGIHAAVSEGSFRGAVPNTAFVYTGTSRERKLGYQADRVVVSPSGFWYDNALLSLVQLEDRGSTPAGYSQETTSLAGEIRLATTLIVPDRSWFNWTDAWILRREKLDVDKDSTFQGRKLSRAEDHADNPNQTRLGLAQDFYAWTWRGDRSRFAIGVVGEYHWREIVPLELFFYGARVTYHHGDYDSKWSFTIEPGWINGEPATMFGLGYSWSGAREKSR